MSNQPWWKRRVVFFRAVGLEIPVILGFGRGIGEQAKFVFTKSPKLALARCGVHLLPITVTFVAVSFNLSKSYSYLGRAIPGDILDVSINIALLQVAAKIQELLIVASTTMVVMDVLRLELVQREGLPLGLLGGGFLYSSISYFWSPEFWGSCRAKYSLSARFRVYGILVVGGLVATLAGPSTAVLLIPKQQFWLAGHSPIYLPGTAATWWPTLINVATVPKVASCNSEQSVSNPICPQGAMACLWNNRDSISILDKLTYVEGTPLNVSSWMKFGPRGIKVQGSPSSFDYVPVLQFDAIYRGYTAETYVIAPRMAEALYQEQLRRDWVSEVLSLELNSKSPSLSEYKYFGDVQVSTKSCVSAMRAVCSSAQETNSTNYTLSFPVLPERSHWYSSNFTSVRNVGGISESPSTSVRATWLSATAAMGAASGGLLLELPSTNEVQRAIVACSFGAYWTPGKIVTASMGNEPQDYVTTTAHREEYTNIFPGSSYTLPGSSIFGSVLENPKSAKIILDASWLENAIPTRGARDSNSTKAVFEELLDSTLITDDVSRSATEQVNLWNTQSVGKINRTVALEWWISFAISNSLSRVGSEQVFNTTGSFSHWHLKNYNKANNFQSELFDGKQALTPPTQPSSPWVIETVDINIWGYAYQASAITDYACIALLLIHVVIALAHILHSAMPTHHLSSSWDSLTELLVLMQNSRPARNILGNVGAGISDLETFSKRAKVYAARIDQPGNGQIEFAELVFEDDAVGQSTQLKSIPPTRPTHGRNTSSSSAMSKTPLLQRPKSTPDELPHLEDDAFERSTQLQLISPAKPIHGRTTSSSSAISKSPLLHRYTFPASDELSVFEESDLNVGLSLMKDSTVLSNIRPGVRYI